MRRFALAALAALTLVACAGAPATSTSAPAPPPIASTSGPTTALPPSAPPPATPTEETPVPDTSATRTAVRFTVGGNAFDATLDDNPSARDLLARLPLTLRIRDFDGVEKTAALAAPLTLDGAPRGADPAPFDIGYYAPDQVLVLYYRDVGFFGGIVALGRFDPAAAALVEQQPDGTTVTIERA